MGMTRLLVLACLLVATAANAEPDPDEPAARAPENTIAIDPIGPIFGLFEVAYARSVSPHVAIAGSFGYMSLGSPNVGWDIFQGTASAPYYFRTTFSGPYLEPGIIYRRVHHDSIDSGSNYGYTETWVGPEVLLGWQWSSDSGFTAALAFGIAQHWGGTHRSAMGVESSTSNDPDANGYFRVGYSF